MDVLSINHIKHIVTDVSHMPRDGMKFMPKIFIFIRQVCQLYHIFQGIKTKVISNTKRVL